MLHAVKDYDMSKIPEDEPVFLLRAQDIIAGAIEEGGAEPGDFDEYLNAGIGFYDAGQYEDAISYFEYCMQLNPNSAALYQYLGNSYHSIGRVSEAISAFEKALELNPEDESLRQWLVEQKGAVG